MGDGHNSKIEKTRFKKSQIVIPHDDIFNLKLKYDEDQNENKVDLLFFCVSLPIVHTVEKILATDKMGNKEYLPTLGLPAFNFASIRLVLGQQSPAIKENRAFGIQVVSGCGGLRLAADFLRTVMGYKIVYFSKPTWGNYSVIFEAAGFEHRTYRYWSETEKVLDINGMLQDLNEAPEDSVVILQVAGHNPTGYDPNKEEWSRVADVIEKRKLFPIFDSVFQGLVSGDLDEDAWPIRYFVLRNFELFCVQSYSKIFCIPSERTGCLIVVLASQTMLPHVKSHFTSLVKASYSSPPAHGALLVAHILNSPQYFVEWKRQIEEIGKKIMKIRKDLRNSFEQLQTPGTWEHITSQRGLFCYLELEEKQVMKLMEKHHVYVSYNGRLCLSGITSNNLEYISRAIHDVITF